MKLTFKILLLLLISISSSAQEVVRVPVNGSITAPVGEPVEGIHVYNISAQKGTVTDVNGFFKMEMAENDRLEVTALQFVSFKVIVDKGIIDTKQVKIYMNPAINELAEVIIRPYDLSGNITVDVGKIKTYNVNEGWDLSYEELEFGYEFAPDAQTSIQGNKADEAFHNGQTQNGLNFIGGAKLLIQAIFGKPKKKKSIEEVTAENKKLYYSFRGRFTDEVIMNDYGIPKDKTGLFIYYLEDKGIPKGLMKQENELLLIQYLTNQSTLFLNQIEE